MTKVKFSKSEENTVEFIERRRASLERYNPLHSYPLPPDGVATPCYPLMHSYPLLPPDA